MLTVLEIVKSWKSLLFGKFAAFGLLYRMSSVWVSVYGDDEMVLCGAVLPTFGAAVYLQ